LFSTFFLVQLQGLVNLKYLCLDNNQISSIEDGAFTSLDRLIELDLSHNELTMITKQIFGSLKSLNRLYLSNNQIREIEKDAFANSVELYLDNQIEESD
jgi:Leucine-rich repeat (LRR) protein